MIILDPSLAAEALKTRPDPAVRAWPNEQSAVINPWNRDQ